MSSVKRLPVCSASWLKKTTASSDDISKAFIERDGLCIDLVSRKILPQNSIANKSYLFQVIVWRQTEDSPWTKAKLTQFANAIRR